MKIEEKKNCKVKLTLSKKELAVVVGALNKPSNPNLEYINEFLGQCEEFPDVESVNMFEWGIWDTIVCHLGGRR